MRIALVASEFNAPIPDRMLAAAEARAKKHGAVIVAVARVPGVWEIPMAARTLLSRSDVDAVVAIGAVVKGETAHDVLIAETVARELMRLQIETGKPVGLGITGPNMTWAQAEARVGNAARGVDAVVRMGEQPRASAKETAARRKHKKVH